MKIYCLKFLLIIVSFSAFGQTKKDKDLSEKLLKLSSEAHYYYPEDQNETWHNSNDLYVELFEEFEKFQKQKLNH